MACSQDFFFLLISWTHYAIQENKMNIRLETKDDYRQVEELTRDAFWNLYAPGCDEHYLCHTLRGHKDFISELDYVAELNGTIIASIMYTESFLLSEDQEKVRTVSFGPLCVHPDYQRKGVGTALIEKTKSIVKSMNIPAIIIYGDPHNYCKHGFRNGIDYHVSTMDGEHPLGLLVLELQNGFFGNKKWKVKQSDAFCFDHEKAVEFDKQFVEKEKKYKYSQEIFKMNIRAFLR
jgi:predicted N-acetyltransferase YhbS